MTRIENNNPVANVKVTQDQQPVKNAPRLYKEDRLETSEFTRPLSYLEKLWGLLKRIFCCCFKRSGSKHIDKIFADLSNILKKPSNQENFDQIVEDRANAAFTLIKKLPQDMSNKLQSIFSTYDLMRANLNDDVYGSAFGGVRGAIMDGVATKIVNAFNDLRLTSVIEGVFKEELKFTFTFGNRKFLNLVLQSRFQK